MSEPHTLEYQPTVETRRDLAGHFATASTVLGGTGLALNTLVWAGIFTRYGGNLELALQICAIAVGLPFLGIIFAALAGFRRRIALLAFLLSLASEGFFGYLVFVYITHFQLPNC